MGRDSAHGVKATGRPIIRSWRSPFMSVQGVSITTIALEGGSAISAAMRVMVPARSRSLGDRGGCILRIEIFLRQQFEGRRGACARPAARTGLSAPASPRVHEASATPVLRSADQRHAVVRRAQKRP
jgi:hypothetical protein